MYSSASSHDFPGIDLRQSADEAGAIDLLNVDFDVLGAVRARDGYDNFTPSEAASDYDAVFSLTGDSGLLAHRTSNIAYVNDAGEAATTAADALTDVTPFGTTATPAFYIATSASSTLKKLVVSGPTFSAPTATVDGVAGRAMPIARYVETAPPDSALGGRLVAASTSSTGGPHGAAGSEYHVWFSEPGNAEAWNTSNYVILNPGDGDVIRGMCFWRGQLFVFKGRRIYSFYGTTTDSAGNPVFNYRTLTDNNGVRHNQAIAVRDDGIYFVNGRGIWRTTGGEPQLISHPVTPLFLGGASAFWQAGDGRGRNENGLRLVAHGDRLFASIPLDPTVDSPVNTHTVVHDLLSGHWTVWDIPMASATSQYATSSISTALYFVKPSGANHIYKLDATKTDDDGTAIVSRYRTGFSDLGTPGEKRPVSTRLWGTGSVELKWSRDFETSLGTAQSYTLGTSPAIDHQVKDSKAKAGRLHSFQVGASSGQWVLHRADHEIEVLHGQNATST